MDDTTSTYKQNTKSHSRRVSSSSRSDSGASMKIKKSASLPSETVEYLKAWMMSPEHIAHPYPTDAEKAKIMEDTGIELKQLTNWFVNNRKRYWKPRVEARLREQTKAPSQDTTIAATSDHVIKPRSTAEAKEKVEVHRMPRHVSLVDLVTSSLQGNTDEPLEPPRDGTVSGRIQGVASAALEDDKKSNRSFRRMIASFCDEHSSVVSINNESAADAQALSDDDSSATGQATSEDRIVMQTKTEFVDVHILKPTGKNLVPQFSDVTVLPHVPFSRILRTFSNCKITFQYPTESSAVSNNELMKKISSARDAEIANVKNHFLSIYLTELETKADANAMGKLNSYEPMTAAFKPNRKRNITDESDPDVSFSAAPRPKFRRASVDVWKRACEEAAHVYNDDDLPTLEEAAQLFGFAQHARKEVDLM